MPDRRLDELPVRGTGGDEADRLIYATAIERGWPLITKDPRLRGHRHPHPAPVWKARAPGDAIRR